MSAKYFLDTNILVYMFDKSRAAKSKKARSLMRNALAQSSGCISWQVVQEFLNVVTRKFKQPFTAVEAQDYLKRVLTPICEIYPDTSLFASALDIQNQTEYSYYDSLIIAGALKAECKILYSEDMQSGHKFQGLKIVNPFE